MEVLVKMLLLLLALAPQITFAQDIRLSASCERFIEGGDGDKASLLAFDRDLRTAMAGEDPAAVALLVNFPLRVNGGQGGTIALNNVAALQARFSEVFPKPIREAVLNQDAKTIFCSYQGIMYGTGQVWVGPRGSTWGVFTVNLPHTRGKEKSADWPKLEMVCNAEKHRVIVDSDGEGRLRYRAWNRPRFVKDEPDLEIAEGTQTVEGRGLCAYNVWTFKDGEAEIQLSGLGCSPDSSPPPTGATGSLDILIPGQPTLTWWCY